MVDDFPDFREQLLAAAGDASSDDDDRGVQRIDQRCQDFADFAARLTRWLNSLCIAGAHEFNVVLAGAGRYSARREPFRDGSTAGHGFQITLVFRVSRGVLAVGDLYMAQVSRSTLSATLEGAALMMPAPIPVAMLMKTRSVTSGQSIARSPRARMFTSLSTSTRRSNDSRR